MRTRVSVPLRVLALVVPVCAAGVAAVGLAAGSFATASRSTADLVALGGLFVAMLVAERFPVPVEEMDAGGVTLGFVFGVAAILLFGWQAGVLLAAAAPALSQLIRRRPPLRVAYNAAMFAVAALAGGLAAAAIPSGSVGALIGRLALCAFLYHWVVNLMLVSAALALDSEQPFRALLRTNVRRTTAPFALMASAALILVVLWQRAPVLSLALVGPVAAIALYQRSTFAALRAMRLALTDPLTGLGNHRGFHERLQRELGRCEEEGAPLSLCLVDVDDFKRVNDLYGHPAGDRVLEQIASRLRQGGESFRVGGDEFVVLLSGLDEPAAARVAGSIVERVAALSLDQVGAVTVSAGVATYSAGDPSRDELVRLADSALYWAKEDGKNRVRSYGATTRELRDLQQLTEGTDRGVRYRAAESLAKAVDARDAFEGRHSERVRELATRIARRLGVDDPEVELTRMAASLHDLGKLAVPEDLLHKPGELSPPEWAVLERHPQIGYRMLESLGAEPVAECVLHHHERWDGTGYPDRLAGEQIPLGARIVSVADAFDAMTSVRAYGAPLTEREALAELERCAGTQFDPTVVEACSQELGVRSPPLVVAI